MIIQRMLMTAACALTLPSLAGSAAAAPGPKMDIVFALDTTGSMADEIALVRRLVWDLANGLVTGKPRPSIRLGLVRFRDRRDTYVTRVTDLTRDLDAVHKTLMATSAGGGGDTPEHVNRALHDALGQKWRPGAKRLVFLIGDARPQNYGDYSHDMEARRARALGVQIHAIGCSGLGSPGVLIFKEIARLSGGSYASLSRGSTSRGSRSDRQLRNLILTRAGLGRYASAAPPKRPKVKALAKPATSRVPASTDPRDRAYTPTPDRVWRSKID